jgi:DNA-binding transcriptional LysR family regulator
MPHMRPINLAACDLNLLVVFEALYEKRHVTKAGRRIGLSQSSMSQALRRLRDMFDDELFTRTPDGMSPTARAEEIAHEILPALGQLRGLLSERTGFDPASSERRFVVGLNDLGSYSVLPRLMPRLRSDAPGVNLNVVNVGSRDAVDKLLSGTVELACGVFDAIPPTVESCKLASFRSVCITDRSNPYLVGRALDLETFLKLPHVRVAVNSDPGAVIDAELSTLSLRRRVALSVPHFLAVPRAVLGTDMIAVVDTEAFSVFENRNDFRTDPVPLPFPEIGVSMIWHRRSESDAGHRWLRNLTASCVVGK